MTKNKNPKWIWKLKVDKKNMLTKPVIQPSEKGWRIKYTLNNKIIVADKIERFGNVEIMYGPYAIITDLSKLSTAN